MRSPTIAVLAAFIPSLVSHATSQSLAHLDTTEVGRWREDLVVLREEMPARHANLFHRMTFAQFDSALGNIERHLPFLARHQVIVALQQVCALVGDGHSNVSPWRDSAAAFHELPISLYWFEDGVIVRAARKEREDLVGARVLAVGGVPIEEAIARVRPLISRDNEMGVRAWAPLLLTMPEVLHSVGLAMDPTRATFSFSTATGQRTVMLTPVGLFPMLTGEIDLTWKKRDGWVDSTDRDKPPLWLSDITNTYWFRYLSETRTLYCQLNAIQQKPDDSLRGFLARAFHVADSAKAERFVLDLRLNGGGNGYWNRDILRSLIKSSYDERGRLAVIVGRRTWSAAQMLIAEIEKYTNATFVGEPSSSRGNAFGDSRRITLPNSHLTVRVSTLWHQYWDPRDDRQWITPQISTPLSFKEYAAGRDPALEAVMKK